MNEYKPKDVDKNSAASLGIPKATMVSPVLKEVSKLAAGVAAVATGSATGNPRNKCALQPGHSLMDWIRLGQSGKDLTGVGPMAGTLSIPLSQLAEHNTEKDAWLAIRGRVYNITPYLPFHPGGIDELMKGAGKDATALFNQIHAWVNYESILQKCYIGRLSSIDSAIEKEAFFEGRDAKSRAKKNLNSNGSINSPPNTSKMDFKPRFDWIQKIDTLTCIFYTKHYCNPQVQVTNPSKENQVNINLTFHKVVYENIVTFTNSLHWPCKVNINYETGKVEVLFKKIVSKIWDNYGTLEQKSRMADDEKAKNKYVVLNNAQVNHNTCILSLQRLDGFKQTIPIGKHINVFGRWNGEEVSRSYTPIPPSIFQVNDKDPVISDVYLLIKKYPHGMLSPVVCGSKKGDILDLSHPMGPFELRDIENKEAFLLVAAGTGITPMMGFLSCVLGRRNRRCQKATLLFFNRTEEDILLREELSRLGKNDDRLKVEHVLSEPNKNWSGKSGHISRDLLKSAIDSHCADTQLFPADIFVTICGPTAFTKITQTLLNEMGYQAQHMHCFLG